MERGTEWTEPGQGATIHEIRREGYALPFRLRSVVQDWAFRLGAHGGNDFARTHRTNLRLTGAPLTAEDLERIANAK